jgi:hypothetical protein
MWGEAELEPEVEEWFARLTEHQRGRVEFYIDLLEQQGALLDEPYTRQLDGKLRELRFYAGRVQTRISYYIAAGRRIILLTVFQKTKPRELNEVKRAKQAMLDCMAAGHTAEED